MSACSEVTLCDPTDPTIKVLVTDPGTADAAGFVLPALTPYGGDLSALVKCSAEAAEAVDCEGNPLASAIVTGASVSAVDAACLPAAPACPVDGMITFNKGVTFQWQGGAWVPVAFTPCLREVVDSGATPLLDVAALDALAATGPGWHIIDERCVDITNDDCVRRMAKFWYEINMGVSYGDGNDWSLRVVGSGGQSSTGALNGGTFWVPPDTRCEEFQPCASTVTHSEDASKQTQSIPINPGSSFIGNCVRYEVFFVKYKSNPLNSIGATTFRLVSESNRNIFC